MLVRTSRRWFASDQRRKGMAIMLVCLALMLLGMILVAVCVHLAAEDPLDCDAETSRWLADRNGVELAPVRLRCVHRSSKNGLVQGLVEFLVEVTVPGFGPVRRRAWFRATVVSGGDDGGWRLVVDEHPVAVEED